jgi:hypothetical protein
MSSENRRFKPTDSASNFYEKLRRQGAIHLALAIGIVPSGALLLTLNYLATNTAEAAIVQPSVEQDETQDQPNTDTISPTTNTQLSRRYYLTNLGQPPEDQTRRPPVQPAQCPDGMMSVPFIDHTTDDAIAKRYATTVANVKQLNPVALQDGYIRTTNGTRVCIDDWTDLVPWSNAGDVAYMSDGSDNELVLRFDDPDIRNLALGLPAIDAAGLAEIQASGINTYSLLFAVVTPIGGFMDEVGVATLVKNGVDKIPVRFVPTAAYPFMGRIATAASYAFSIYDVANRLYTSSTYGWALGAVRLSENAYMLPITKNVPGTQPIYIYWEPNLADAVGAGSVGDDITAWFPTADRPGGFMASIERPGNIESAVYTTVERAIYMMSYVVTRPFDISALTSEQRSALLEKAAYIAQQMSLKKDERDKPTKEVGKDPDVCKLPITRDLIDIGLSLYAQEYLLYMTSPNPNQVELERMGRKLIEFGEAFQQPLEDKYDNFLLQRVWGAGAQWINIAPFNRKTTTMYFGCYNTRPVSPPDELNWVVDEGLGDFIVTDDDPAFERFPYNYGDLP